MTTLPNKFENTINFELKDVMELIHMKSRANFRRYRIAGLIGERRIGRRVYIPRSEVIRILEEGLPELPERKSPASARLNQPLRSIA